MERDLLAFPVRLGGLGLVNPCKVSHSNFKDLDAEDLTSLLAAHIIGFIAHSVNHDHDHMCQL